jgi:putative hydrolase of the HAD superfamily
MAQAQLKQLPEPTDIDAIILDFGGVLFNIDYDAPARAFQALGMTDFRAIYSQAAQTDLFDRLEVGKISNEDFLEALKQYLPHGVNTEQVLHAWNVILLDIPKHRIDFVHRLAQRYRLFLLSNTNAIHVAEFEQTIDRTMGLAYFRQAFERIHYSNVLGRKKPYPETYLHVCALHNLAPSRTLFIDDSVQHVVGALSAGLHAYHLEVPQEELADVLVAFDVAARK